MRIIAGEARGRTLFAPKGMQTRPTADRVREALYNILASKVAGARVFDAFAGSGAMSLEALSRGAAFSVMSDISREACACIERNAKLCRFEDRIRLVNGDWKKALAGERIPFDLVILDPPYCKTEIYRQVLSAIADAKLLGEDGVAVLECAREAEVSPGDGFEVFDTRVYGAAQVLLCRARREKE